MIQPQRPTVTKDFLKCPMYWHLKKSWQPKPGDWTPYKLMGTAIHAGAHEFWVPTPGMYPDTKAQEVLGASFVEQPRWTLEGCQKLVSKGLAEALGAVPGHIHWAQTEELVGSELDLGHCHPDLVTRSKATGKLIVTDLKTTYHLKPQWVTKRLMSYETDWQFHHYAWAVEEHFKEPVQEVRVQLVALTPQTTNYVVGFKYSPQRLANWLSSAERVWALMDWLSDDDQSPVQNLNSCEQFGGCEFKTACHTLELDEKSFESFYDPVNSQGADGPPSDDDY